MVALLSASPRPPTEVQPDRPPACDHCKRRLHNEFYFRCLKCGACYCYIHMRRHEGAHQTRRVATPPVLVARRRMSGASASANV